MCWALPLLQSANVCACVYLCACITKFGNPRIREGGLPGTPPRLSSGKFWICHCEVSVYLIQLKAEKSLQSPMKMKALSPNVHEILVRCHGLGALPVYSSFPQKKEKKKDLHLFRMPDVCRQLAGGINVQS